MIRSIIVDDEYDSRIALKSLLAPFVDEFTIVGEATNVEEAVTDITTKKPDLVFMDIHLNNNTAFDILRVLKGIDFKIIFVTGYDKFAIQAIKYSALDYLLKPIDPDELEKALLKAKKEISKDLLEAKVENLIASVSSKPKRLILNTQDGVEFIDTDKIVWLQAEKSYTNIYMLDGSTVLHSKNLKYFEALLDTDTFYRIHHSALINMNHLVKYSKEDGGMVVMVNNAVVPVATRRKADLLNKMMDYQ